MDPPVRHALESNELRFVNLTQSLTLDPDSRTIIRTHVMHNYLQGAGRGNNNNNNNSLSQKVKIASNDFNDLADGQLENTGPINIFRLDSQGLTGTGNQNGREATRRERRIKKATAALSSRQAKAERKSATTRGSGLAWRPRTPDRKESSSDQDASIESVAHISQTKDVGIFPAVLRLRPSSVGSWNIDPFNSLPIPTSRSTEFLAYHYHARICCSVSLMMAIRQEWFSMALHDAAFFHVSMSHSATFLTSFLGTGDPTEALMHKTAAIRIINERLQCLDNGISDGTIAAVASMASYEATKGTLFSTETHFNGLEEMVKAQGLHWWQFAAPLRRLICWIDVQCASALSTALRFPPMDDLNLSPDLDSTRTAIPNLQMETAENQDTEFELCKVDKTLAALFDDLRHLSGFLAGKYPDFSHKIDDISCSDKLYSVNRRLVSLLDQYRDKTSRIERSCCIAALMYINCYLREVRPLTRIIRDFVVQLKASMIELDGSTGTLQSVDDVAISKLVVWALVLGATMAPAGPERTWFISRLMYMLDIMHVVYWEDVEVMLKTIVWPEEVLPTGSMWKIVENTLKSH